MGYENYDSDVDYKDSFIKPSVKKAREICEDDIDNYLTDGDWAFIINRRFEDIKDYLEQTGAAYEFVLECLEDGGHDVPQESEGHDVPHESEGHDVPQESGDHDNDWNHTKHWHVPF